MSVDGTKLLFEGFLQKRKDTLKIRWVTYWFRLQNTTLFFYTQKNGSASHLRGYYYIYTVQSVREVQRTNCRRFMFEIIMTNGKRKVLAAETAALRKEWVGHLWQAMHLSASVVLDSRVGHLEVCEQRDRLNTSAHSDSVMELLPARPLSAPAPSDYTPAEARSITSAVCPPEEANGEEATNLYALPACHHHTIPGDSLDRPDWSSVWSHDNGQEGDYDVLPLRNTICELNPLTEAEDGVYDFPLSYRMSAEHQAIPDPTESIYDVPSTLLRTLSDHSPEEQLQEGTHWRI